MSLRSFIQHVFRIQSGYVPPTMTTHSDADIGEYTYYSGTGLWTAIRRLQGREIQICGRSAAPTEEQKKLLDVFFPKLVSLTGSALAMLTPPNGSPRHPLPNRLILREVRFESTGVVELFFDPELDWDGYSIWPMASCSPEAHLLSVEWTT
ncbi:hypothetical protein [Verrucomicrobium sp. BvORR034]|uniref:hypothetical protein n=1 Tax=Verrucomicrobium sp. BvORR034 TaxID=1396418 RepID=UPI0006789466|nr:hypothetical protein [Verrucomicrobium sp. BvORR034]